MGRLPFPVSLLTRVLPPYGFVVYLRGLDPVPLPINFIMGGKAGVLSGASKEVPLPLSRAREGGEYFSGSRYILVVASK